MSHTQSTSTSSNFQLIFDNALEAYKKRTKNDLLTHPLADRLEACDSASSILTVLQQQVEKLNQSQRRNERWTRWLDPTVKVLHAFSDTLGEGVALVRLSFLSDLRALILIWQAFPSAKAIFTAVGVLFLVCILSNMFVPPIVIRSPLRQLRMSVQVRTLFLRYSSD